MPSFSEKFIANNKKQIPQSHFVSRFFWSERPVSIVYKLATIIKRNTDRTPIRLPVLGSSYLKVSEFRSPDAFSDCMEIYASYE